MCKIIPMSLEILCGYVTDTDVNNMLTINTYNHFRLLKNITRFFGSLIENIS